MKTTKKFDKKVVSDLIEKIKTQLKKPKNKRCLELNRKEANIIKTINPDWVYNPRGEWNGYGYDRLPQHIVQEFFVQIGNKLKKLETKTVEIKERKILSQEEKNEKWAKRLMKFVDITLSEAIEIAEEKIEYKNQKIYEMIQRDCEAPSIRRGKLIEKMERENPLRPIKDSEHAQAIIIASNRHNNTDYDYQLDEAREQAQLGNIDRSEVKEYARMNMK